jgi:plasmid stability protein
MKRNWRQSQFVISLIFRREKETQMAGDLCVRNVNDDLIARLKRRAARHGRSTEAEHHEILRLALARETEPAWDELAAQLRELTRGRIRIPSEILMREGRAERGLEIGPS